jgi:hypothetical protein
MSAIGRRDDRSSWRIGRLAGVKLTLSNNRRISAVDPLWTSMAAVFACESAPSPEAPGGPARQQARIFRWASRKKG